MGIATIFATSSALHISIYIYDPGKKSRKEQKNVQKYVAISIFTIKMYCICSGFLFLGSDVPVYILEYTL